MAVRRRLTDRQIAVAIDALVAQGRRLSIAALQEHLAVGSERRLGMALARWRCACLAESVHSPWEERDPPLLIGPSLANFIDAVRSLQRLGRPVDAQQLRRYWGTGDPQLIHGLLAIWRAGGIPELACHAAPPAEQQLRQSSGPVCTATSVANAIRRLLGAGERITLGTVRSEMAISGRRHDRYIRRYLRWWKTGKLSVPPPSG